ncbi:hypothetical protein P691DRAFT_803497 [Macrolepiota fuliginosa MF-IS2]|uniref:Uncharacterized protein n=1 Tax=Macrolepiota fuliginosa MF-IS2 TaxID=1400762 RepID=A0A9P5XLP2_9AGAR|nr:hypothetical protein P691DRAFT_803497 [Macrolepiota fuliginosa MF-IS2]
METSRIYSQGSEASNDKQWLQLNVHNASRKPCPGLDTYIHSSDQGGSPLDMHRISPPIDHIEHPHPWTSDTSSPLRSPIQLQRSVSEFPPQKLNPHPELVHSSDSSSPARLRRRNRWNRPGAIIVTVGLDLVLMNYISCSSTLWHFI